MNLQLHNSKISNRGQHNYTASMANKNALHVHSRQFGFSTLYIHYPTGCSVSRGLSCCCCPNWPSTSDLQPPVLTVLPWYQSENL